MQDCHELQITRNDGEVVTFTVPKCQKTPDHINGVYATPTEIDVCDCIVGFTKSFHVMQTLYQQLFSIETYYEHVKYHFHCCKWLEDKNPDLYKTLNLDENYLRKEK